MFSIETITDFERLESLAGEWDELHAKLSPRLPYTSALWCLTWWRRFRRASLGAEDRLHSYVLRDANGVLVAIAPMFVTARPGWDLPAVRELQFFGVQASLWRRRPVVTEWRGVICLAEIVEEATDALAAHIRREQCAHIVQWRGLPAAMDHSRLTPAFESHAEMDTILFYLELPGSWEEFRRRRPRNVKESLRKCYNSLARESHDFQFRVVTSPAEAQAALDVFFDLHRLRACAPGMIRHADVFDTKSRRDFLRAYCDAMAKTGQLRIAQLVIADKVVATRVAFAYGDELYLYFSGYDVAWSRFSVMTTTVAETIKWAIDRKVRLLYLSTGADVSKTRWRPLSVKYCGGWSVGLAPALQLAFRRLLTERRRRLGGGATEGIIIETN